MWLRGLFSYDRFNEVAIDVVVPEASHRFGDEEGVVSFCARPHVDACDIMERKDVFCANSRIA